LDPKPLGFGGNIKLNAIGSSWWQDPTLLGLATQQPNNMQV